MTRRLLSGVWEHIRTGVSYRVMGLARPVKTCNTRVVVYASCEETPDRTGKGMLPAGTLWTREYADWYKKFRYRCE